MDEHARGADSRARPLVLGPRPPPLGGIATIMAELAAWPEVDSSVQFLDTTKRDDSGRIARPLRLLRELRQRLRGRPACALSFSSAFGSFWEKGMWLTLCRWHGVPMAVMMVDGNFPRFYDSLGAPARRLARAILERFSTVIVQTESWRRYYEGIAPGGRYLVLPNGVDASAFAPASHPVDREAPTLLFVGWTTPEKGVFDLIEAAAHLHSRGHRFVLKIVGPFHGQEAALRAAVTGRQLDSVVEVVGPVPSRASLLTMYAAADVFVLPSLAEGLPVAMLEAMASGLPVVGTRVGGVPDLIEDGRSGYLVSPRQPLELAAALEKLIVDSDARATMGAAARQRVETKFSSVQFISGLLALLGSRGRMPSCAA